MGEDLSTGAKIGITLIILCTLIAIVFSLLTMMKNITNSGASQLQGSLDQMLLTQFDDYNQKTVSGTQVVSSIKVFEGQDVAIVVRPALAVKGQVNSTSVIGGFNYGSLLSGYYVDDPKAMSGYGNIYTTTQNVTIPESKTDTNGCPVYSDSSDFSTGIYMHESLTYYVGAFADDGSVLVPTNTNTRPLEASGKCSYVRSSAKYRAMLIKDASDTIIGVCFTELTNK